SGLVSSTLSVSSTPATLTPRSVAPQLSSTCCTTFSTATASVTSSDRYHRLSVVFSLCFDTSRSVATTRQPASHRCATTAATIPPVAPVTNAILPSNPVNVMITVLWNTFARPSTWQLAD